MTNFNLFEISLSSLNFFSFMLGVTWAFFQQGVFGKRIGSAVIAYFAALAAWYAFRYYLLVYPELGKIPVQ